MERKKRDIAFGPVKIDVEITTRRCYTLVFSNYKQHYRPSGRKCRKLSELIAWT